MKKKWYLRSWFLCFVFAFSIFILPLILGIFLLIASIQEDSLLQKEWQNIDAMRTLKFTTEDRLRYDSFFEKDRVRAKAIEEEDRLRSEVYTAESAKLTELKLQIESAATEYQELVREILVANVNIESYRGIPSADIKNQLSLLNIQQKDMIKNETAYGISSTTRSQLKVRALENLKKQIMRCFNSESSVVIDSVSVKNVDSSRDRIQRSYEQINKIFEQDGLQVSRNYLESKFEELTLVYAYMIILEEERETQRAIREEMQEEERVRREIEREKVKIEKEEQQFSNEINKLMQYLQKASEIEKQLYVDKIKELEEKLKLVAKDKENVFEREQNTRAGFVYIISNIGSFGENIYKIGMTRRLEPMDRIRELSSASVPFAFDVHAMIFSHDAPGLETVLHNTFRESQVNLMNTRKEFFNIDLTKIKDVVLEHHNSTVNFEDIPDAMEYRETLKLLNA